MSEVEKIIIPELDPTDNKILAILSENGRATYSEIGSEIGISRVAVKNRMDSMEERGIIKGYTVEIDRSAAAVNRVEFLLIIEADPERFGEVITDLSKEEYITKIQTITGRNKMIAYGYAPNPKLLNDYVDKLYWRMSGIKNSHLEVVLSTRNCDGGVNYESNGEEGR